MVELGKYNLEVINHINIFETLTKSMVKDCFIDDKGRFVFIVNKEDIGKVIGKNASNLRRIQDLLKKRIKIVAFSDDIKDFIKSYVNPVEIEAIDINDNIVEIKANGANTKGLLIGRDRKNLETLKQVLKKYYGIIDVKVI